MKIDRMGKAKMRCMIKHAFFGALVANTTIEPDDTIETACTDMVKIHYSPKFIDSLESFELVLFVLCHELLHIVYMHGIRKGSRHHTLWNIACDHAINLILKESGLEVWKHACCDKRFENMSAEQIYDILYKEVKEECERRAKQGRGKPQSGDGEGKGKGQGPSMDDVIEEMFEGDGIGDDLRKPDSLGKDGGAGGDDDMPISKEKAEQMRGEIQKKVAQAAVHARQRGKMPAGLERLIKQVLEPQVPWEDQLREFMTRLTRTDESWSRRSRRVLDTFLPGILSANMMGEVIVIGDTSGSMDDKAFGMMAGEINAICDNTRPERIRVIWADAEECCLEEVFEEGEELVLHPKGGGGTDMRLPLAFVEKYEPTVVILLTDGYTPWPKENPPYPLIVCCTTNAPVPIGEVIRLQGLT